jgi:predicted nucleic acid-binding protein
LIVIDASVTLSWLLLDEIDDFAKESAIELANDSAIVPAIFPAEVTNALVMAHRRGRIERTIVTDGLRDLGQLPIVVESARIAMEDEVDLSIKHGLSIYDSMYLALARRQRIALVTRDNRLADAAAKENVVVKYAPVPAG